MDTIHRELLRPALKRPEPAPPRNVLLVLANVLPVLGVVGIVYAVVHGVMQSVGAIAITLGQ